MFHLTTHFTTNEFIHSPLAERKGISNALPRYLFANVLTTATGLEKVRELPELHGSAIIVNSGYRSKELNDFVGGAKDSAHLTGLAVDFTCTNASPKETIRAIIESAIDFDQVIYEGSWVHLSFAPAMRHQVLTAHFGPGGTTYTKGITA